MSAASNRAAKAIARHEEQKLKVAKAKEMNRNGCSNLEIGRQLGINESTVRIYLKK